MFNSTLKIAGSLALVVMFLQACASARTCYNDACYDRKIASGKADVAAWGSEKEIYEQEKMEHKIRRHDAKGN